MWICFILFTDSAPRAIQSISHNVRLCFFVDVSSAHSSSNWNQESGRLTSKSGSLILPFCGKVSTICFCFEFCLGDRWHVTGDMWQVTCDRWQVKGDWWQVTGYRQKMKGDMWQVTGDSWTFFSSSFRLFGIGATVRTSQEFQFLLYGEFFS